VFVKIVAPERPDSGLEAVGALAGGFDAARNHHPCTS
jgi:hypothetical protein